MVRNFKNQILFTIKYLNDLLLTRTYFRLEISFIVHCRLWISSGERGHQPAFEQIINSLVGLPTLDLPRGPF